MNAKHALPNHSSYKQHGIQLKMSRNQHRKCNLKKKILLVALRQHSGEKDTDQVFLINFRKILLTNLLWNIQKLIRYFVTAVFVPSKVNISFLVWHHVILKMIKKEFYI